ncbi:DUF3087 family protein [sulfur-oxidizing endosymbiont of Gigantopelta aegis]|uniref:DUF3087 family protein n=1 Tax=sulfur-oxidizing endosymbiont of Gigantopelta aegis TaxID=2794934 RepID=UPI0018DB4FCA|nr:DUF3087 family protein [sulfur-oxidizing endosymbiont of Gigantopelta aegis]
MFKIEEIDPVHYRKQTRKSTLIIMGIFIVIGFTTARYTVVYFGEYSDSHIVLNFLGAFVGLLITFGIVNTFFKDANWMKEAMYAWRLKRHIMSIYNAMKPLQEAADQGDIEAIKILRFYHLGTEQMYQLDNNSHGLMELKSQMQALEAKMKEMDIEANQTEFNMESVAAYRN